MSYDPAELKFFTDVDSEVIMDSAEAYKRPSRMPAETA